VSAIRFALLIAVLSTSACGRWGFVHDEKLDGPYHLVAVDEMEQMTLCRSLEDGDCPGVGPDETVFAAGANRKFVVLARHPREFPNPADRTKTEYYYVIRTANEAKEDLPPENVKGPFTEQQFALERRRLGLPGFSRVFEELK
jgi:hypothetical protein